MRNDFENMCKSLDECNKGCKCSKYKCAKEAVENYVEMDKDRLLQLKAEAEGGDFYSYSAFTLAMTSLIVSCLDSIFDSATNDGIFEWIMSIFKILIIATCVITYLYRMRKFTDVLKWRSYISIAISEHEKEIENFCDFK